MYCASAKYTATAATTETVSPVVALTKRARVWTDSRGFMSAAAAACARGDGWQERLATLETRDEEERGNERKEGQ